jgi:hypothetical protein
MKIMQEAVVPAKPNFAKLHPNPQDSRFVGSEDSGEVLPKFPSTRFFYAYLSTMERQTFHLNTIASMMENQELKPAIVGCVAAIQRELVALREQIQALAERG